jgi:hypothetical protein
MIAHLNKPLHRFISIPGIDGIVVVTITPAGLSLRLKGSQRQIEASWDTVAAVCTMPEGARIPRFLVGKPFEHLQVVAGEIAARKKASGSERGDRNRAQHSNTRSSSAEHGR